MSHFVQPSKPVSWLQGAQPVPADQYAPRLYHLPQWSGWSDKKKLRSLREMAEQYGRDPSFRVWVINSVVSGTNDRDMVGRAAKILSWVQQNIRYSYEPNELIQSPAYTLKVRVGDCDDMAILMGAMATAINLPWKFVLAGKDSSGKPYRVSEGSRFPWGVSFHHIYVEFGTPAFKPQMWMSADATIKTAPLGYDVVEAQRGARGKGPVIAELAGWGAVETPGSPSTDVPVSPGVMPQIAQAGKSLFGMIPWSEVFVGAVQGVLTAVILQSLLKERK